MSVSCEHAFQICSSCIVLSSSVQRFPFVCIVPHTLCTQKCGICCKICVQQLLLSAMRSCPLFFLQDEAQAYTSSKRSRHAGRPFLLVRGMSNSSGTGSGIPGGYTVVLTLALTPLRTHSHLCSLHWSGSHRQHPCRHQGRCCPCHLFIWAQH